MSTYEASYCSQSDVKAILPELGKYNQRSILAPNWVASDTPHLFYLHSAGGSGYSVLFKDGKDLGAEHGSEPSSDNQWRFVEADGRLEYYIGGGSANTLNGSVWQFGEDADQNLTKNIARASDFVRSMSGGMPIYPRKGVGNASATGNDYPELIVRCTAYVCASFITESYDEELSNRLMAKVTNEDNTGFLDRLRGGEITISQQESLQKNKGIVRRVSVNASSTSDIVDVRGRPTARWDLIKIIITTAGTLERGTDSTVKYSTFGSSSDGLQVDEMVEDEIVTGGWDHVGRGMYVRFSAGVLTLNDTWEMEISGEVGQNDTPIKISYLERV